MLKALEGHLDCDVFLRGNVLTLDGDREATSKVGREVVRRAVRADRAGPRDLARHDRRRHVRARPAREPVDDPRRRRLDAPLARAWRRRPSTRSATSTRSGNNTITFGIGPAGTGKTYLAMAMATAALSRRDVNRIILTRPAVEAGERLGFLPGTMMEKVDPYLRPLFDALYDMLDAERVNTLPRAGRDRGRAAGVHARPHAERLVHHPRRGAEHHARADEDVPHAARLQLDDGRDRATSPRSTCRATSAPGWWSCATSCDEVHRHRLHQLHRRGRRAPQARAADRERLRRRTRRRPAPDLRAARAARQRRPERRDRARVPARAAAAALAALRGVRRRRTAT